MREVYYFGLSEGLKVEVLEDCVLFQSESEYISVNEAENLIEILQAFVSAKNSHKELV